jgi:hypothetical protein
MSEIERKIWKCLAKHKCVLPTGLKYKVTPYYIKPPHLSGFPKVHKHDIHLRPIFISIGYPAVLQTFSITS